MWQKIQQSSIQPLGRYSLDGEEEIPVKRRASRAIWLAIWGNIIDINI